MNQKMSDLIVIGSGPAGLAAAIKAKESGIDTVIVMERGERLGGLLHQCIHNGFGLHYFGKDLTGPEFIHYFIKKALDLNVEIKLNTMVTSLSHEDGIQRVIAQNSREGVIEYTSKAVILSMGCREKTRGALHIPGTRPAGILTAGTAQRFINLDGFMPGNEVLILGSGDIGMIMARRMTLEGAHVKAVVEILPYCGGLARNEIQCLRDFDIPLLLSHTVTEIHGRHRVEGVTIAKVDKDFQPIPGTAQHIKCDTLLLSVGLIPENELSRMAGIELDRLTGGPIVDDSMETNIDGIFACGNVVQVHELVDNVCLESEIAGVSAAKYFLEGGKTTDSGFIRLIAGADIRYVVPQKITKQKEVTLYMRVKRPDENVVLKVGDDIYERRLFFVRPSEMIVAKLSLDHIMKIKNGTEELNVSIVGLPA
jgi:thioredoxin reductase